MTSSELQSEIAEYVATYEVKKISLDGVELDLTQYAKAEDVTQLKGEIDDLAEQNVNQQELIGTNTNSTTILMDRNVTMQEQIDDIVANMTYLTSMKPEGNTVAECLNWLEANGDTTKRYLLPDGYLYEYKKTKYLQDTYTNLVPTSTDSSGNIYNDVGYKLDTRLNSTGAEKEQIGCIVTGFMPITKDSVLRIKNFAKGLYSYFVGTGNAINLYDSSYTLLTTNQEGIGSVLYNNNIGTMNDSTGIYTVNISDILDNDDIAFVRVSTFVIDLGTNATDNLASEVIVTVNEEITDGEYVYGYVWSSSGLTSIMVNYSGDIEEHEERLTGLEDIVDDWDNIPDYVVEEAESTIAKVFAHGILGRTIRFIAISDTHEDSEMSYSAQITISNKHAGQAIKYIADRIGLDFIAHTGDASSAGAFTTSYLFETLCKDVEQINNFIFSGVRGIKTVFIPGNHDQCYCTDEQRLFNSGAYTLFGSLCEGKKDRIGGYGYFDIEDAKVRVIYLNTSDVESATTAGTLLAISQEQKNWLCETLIDVNGKDDPDEWKILLLSHAPLDFGVVNIATDILLAYVNGGTYGSYTFTNNNVQILSNIHGHVHCYSYGYMAAKIRRFAIPNACYIGNNHYGSREGYESWVDSETYAKIPNTGKDTAFSLVTIDLDSGMCYVDNYGAGIDREFSTAYNNSYT